MSVTRMRQLQTIRPRSLRFERPQREESRRARPGQVFDDRRLGTKLGTKLGETTETDRNERAGDDTVETAELHCLAGAFGSGCVAKW